MEGEGGVGSWGGGAGWEVGGGRVVGRAKRREPFDRRVFNLTRVPLKTWVE